MSRLRSTSRRTGVGARGSPGNSSWNNSDDWEGRELGGEANLITFDGWPRGV